MSGRQLSRKTRIPRSAHDLPSRTAALSRTTRLKRPVSWRVYSVRIWLRRVRAGSHRSNGHGRFGWPQCSEDPQSSQIQPVPAASPAHTRRSAPTLHNARNLPPAQPGDLHASQYRCPLAEHAVMPRSARLRRLVGLVVGRAYSWRTCPRESIGAAQCIGRWPWPSCRADRLVCMFCQGRRVYRTAAASAGRPGVATGRRSWIAAGSWSLSAVR
jgi:hypothetical protein